MSTTKNAETPQQPEGPGPTKRFLVQQAKTGNAWKVVDTEVLDQRWPKQPRIVQWFQGQGPALVYADKLNEEGNTTDAGH